MNHRIQNEKDLEALIGQYESIRIDFKSSRLLGSDQNKKQIAENLAKEVSAFANTEGGVLVVGIETGKDAEKAMAKALSEGIDPSLIKPEWLQQVVASNISPPLNGLVVRPIPLSGSRAGRVAYVIEIPKGETAHQAPDLRYYGRHELESKPLADNEIRLRMNRGRAARAVIEMMSSVHLTAEEEFNQRQAELSLLVREENEGMNETGFVPPAMRRSREERKKQLSAPKRVFDEYTLKLSIKNDGPITIRDCSLLLVAPNEPDMEFDPKPTNGGWELHFLSDTFPQKISSLTARKIEFVPVRDQKLFPQQVMPFPRAIFEMHIPAGSIPKNAIFQWTLYLEDAPAVTGTIDFSSVFTHCG